MDRKTLILFYPRNSSLYFPVLASFYPIFVSYILPSTLFYLLSVYSILVSSCPFLILLSNLCLIYSFFHTLSLVIHIFYFCILLSFYPSIQSLSHIYSSTFFLFAIHILYPRILLYSSFFYLLFPILCHTFSLPILHTFHFSHAPVFWFFHLTLSIILLVVQMPSIHLIFASFSPILNLLYRGFLIWLYSCGPFFHIQFSYFSTAYK